MMGTVEWNEIIQCNPSELSKEMLDEYMQFAWENMTSKQQSGNIYSSLLSEKNSRQNRATVILSLIISSLALLLAFLSLLFSCMDWYGDKAWQASQIKELQIHSRYLNEITNDAQQINSAESQGGAEVTD